MTQFTPPPAPSEIEAFIGQVVTDLSAAFSGVLVNVGRKLGLYQAMADLGACTLEREELDLEIKQRDDRQHREGHIDDQLHHQPGDAIGFGAGQDLREHVGMHPLAGDVPGSCLQLVGGQRISEPAIFPRQNDVLKKPTRGMFALMMGNLTGLLRSRSLWLTDASVTTT